jgi:hypothetical protein
MQKNGRAELPASGVKVNYSKHLRSSSATQIQVGNIYRVLYFCG